MKRKETTYETTTDYEEDGKTLKEETRRKRKIERTVYARRDKEIFTHSPLLYFALGLIVMFVAVRALLLMD